LPFEGRALRPLDRKRDGRLVRRLHVASIHSIVIVRYKHAADRINTTVSIWTAFVRKWF
jgi:hypothetical protein